MSEQSLTRDEKISLICEHMGIPERDVPLCKKNFDVMTDARLDAELIRLKVGSGKIEAWRKQRHNPWGHPPSDEELRAASQPRSQAKSPRAGNSPWRDFSPTE